MEIVRCIPLAGLLVFTICILFISIRKRRNGIVVSNRKKGLKTVVSTILLVLFFVVFFAELVFQTFTVSYSLLPELLRHKTHHSVALSGVGAAFVVISAITLIYTLKSFKTSLRFGLDSNNLGELVTSGIFAYSRNPFFVSILLLFTGIALVFPSVFFVGIAVLSYVSIHFFILKEEKFMLENYGEEYKKYCNRTRRYF